MSQTCFQPSPSKNPPFDSLPSAHKGTFDHEQSADSLHKISQVSTQPEDPSLPSLPSFPIQETLGSRLTTQTNHNRATASIPRGAQSNKLTIQASFLRRVCAVLVSLTLWTVSTSSVIETESMLKTLCVIAFCCFGYLTFENLYVWVTAEDSQEHLFNILDGLFVMYFLCVINFQHEKNLASYLLIVSPCLFFLSLCLYLWKSQAKKREKIIIRLSSTIQASLIIAKIWGFIPFTWLEVLIPLRVCLLGHPLYGLYTMIESLIRMIEQRDHYEINGSSLRKNGLSVSWYLLYYGLSSLALVTLLDICLQIEREENFVPIGVLAGITQYYCSFFFVYTLIFIQLMKMFNINMNEYFEFEILRDKIERYSLEPQEKNKISYFMKVSPTYFVKVDKEKSQETNSNRSKIEEALCFLCEKDQPDMILMDCGHGGMCKNCLLASMKKNNKCLQCRSPIKAIYQIKKESKCGTGPIEAYEAFCVVR